MNLRDITTLALVKAAVDGLPPIKFPDSTLAPKTQLVPAYSKSPAQVATENIYKNPAVTRQQYDQAADYSKRKFGDPNRLTVPWLQYNTGLPVYKNPQMPTGFITDNAEPERRRINSDRALFGQPAMSPSEARHRLSMVKSQLGMQNGRVVNVDAKNIKEIEGMGAGKLRTNNMTRATYTPGMLEQHEFNHATDSQLVSNPDADKEWPSRPQIYKYKGEFVTPSSANYFDEGSERAQGVRSMQQGMYQALGSRAASPEEFKTRVDGYLNNRPGFDRSKLNPEQQRYLNYLENTRGRPGASTLEQDAINAPGLSYNVRNQRLQALQNELS